MLHNEEIENVITDTREDMKYLHAQLIVQTIQHWDITCIGFLKNLHPDVDVVALSDFFRLQINLLASKDIPFGFKVKTPYDGKKRDPNKTTHYRDRIQAVHVEVVGAHKKESSNYLVLPHDTNVLSV